MRRILLLLLLLSYLGFACVNLSDPTTFGSDVVSPYNGIFYINNDIALCKDNYSASFKGPFLIVNGSYELDLNDSVLEGIPGSWAVILPDGASVKRGTFKGFSADLLFLNFSPSDTPSYDSYFTWDPSSSMDYYNRLSGVYDSLGYLTIANSMGCAGPTQAIARFNDGSEVDHYRQCSYALGSHYYTDLMELPNGYLAVGTDGYQPLFMYYDQKLDAVKYMNDVPQDDYDWTNLSDGFTSVERINDSAIVMVGYSNYSDVASSLVIYIANASMPFNRIVMRTLSAPNGDNYIYPNDAVIDRDGNLVIVGDQLNRSAGTMNAFILKYSLSSLSVIWSKDINITEGNDSFKGIAVDQYNNYVVVGSQNNETVAFIGKFDPSGNNLWNFTYDSAGNDSFNAVEVDPLNRYVVGGISDSTNAYLIYVDSDGNQLYSHELTPVDTGYNYQGYTDVVLSPTGYAYMVGYFSQDIYGNYDTTQGGWLIGVYYLSVLYDPVVGGTNTISNISFVGPSVYMTNNDLSGMYSQVDYENLTFKYSDSMDSGILYLDFNDVFYPTNILQVAWGNTIMVHPKAIYVPDDLDPSWNPYTFRLSTNCSSLSNLQLVYSSNDPTSDPYYDFADAVQGSELSPLSESCISNEVYEGSSDQTFSIIAVHIDPTKVCLDPYDPSTYYGRVHSINNRTFYLLDSAILCTNNYTISAQPPDYKYFLVLNGSFDLDCNNSILSGNPFISAVHLYSSNSQVSNCIFNGSSLSAFYLRSPPNRPAEFESLNFYDASEYIDEPGSRMIFTDYYIYVTNVDNSRGGDAILQVLKVDPITSEPVADWRYNLTSNGDKAYALAYKDGVLYIGGAVNTSSDYEKFILAVNTSENYNILWEWYDNVSSNREAITSLLIMDNYIYALGYVEEENLTLYKFDLSGNLIFNKNYTIDVSGIPSLSLTPDKNNNILIYFSRNAGPTYFTEPALIKVDSNGNQIWNVTDLIISQQYDYVKDVVVLPDNSIVMSVYSMFLTWDAFGWIMAHFDSDGNLLTIQDSEMTLQYPDGPYAIDYYPGDKSVLLFGQYNWDYETAFTPFSISGLPQLAYSFDLYTEGQGFDEGNDIYIHPTGVAFMMGRYGSIIGGLGEPGKFDGVYFGRYLLGSNDYINNLHLTNITFLRKSLFYIGIPYGSATIQNLTLYSNGTNSSHVEFPNTYTLSNTILEEGYNVVLSPKYIQFYNTGLTSGNVYLEANCNYPDAGTRYKILSYAGDADYETAVNDGNSTSLTYQCNNGLLNISISDDLGYTYYDDFSTTTTLNDEDVFVTYPSSVSSGMFYNLTVQLNYNNGTPITDYPVYICQNYSLEPTVPLYSSVSQLSACAIGRTDSSGLASLGIMPSTSALAVYFNKSPGYFEIFSYSDKRREDLYNLSVVQDFYIPRYSFNGELINKDQIIHQSSYLIKLNQNLKQWLEAGGGNTTSILVTTTGYANGSAINLTQPLIAGEPYLVNVHVECLPCDSGLPNATVKVIESGALSPLTFPQTGGNTQLTLTLKTNSSGDTQFIIIPSGNLSSGSQLPYNLTIEVYDEFDRLLANGTVPVVGNTYSQPSGTPTNINNDFLAYLTAELQRLINRIKEQVS